MGLKKQYLYPHPDLSQFKSNESFVATKSHINTNAP